MSESGRVGGGGTDTSDSVGDRVAWPSQVMMTHRRYAEFEHCGDCLQDSQDVFGLHRPLRWLRVVYEPAESVEFGQGLGLRVGKLQRRREIEAAGQLHAVEELAERQRALAGHIRPLTVEVGEVIAGEPVWEGADASGSRERLHHRRHQRQVRSADRVHETLGIALGGFEVFGAPDHLRRACLAR